MLPPVPRDRGLNGAIGITFDDDNLSIIVMTRQLSERRAVRRLGVHEHQAIKLRRDIDSDLSGPATLLNALRHSCIDQVTFPGLNAHRARARASERVDVPKLCEVWLERGRKCFQIALDDGELEIGVLRAKLMIDGHLPNPALIRTIRICRH